MKTVLLFALALLVFGCSPVNYPSAPAMMPNGLADRTVALVELDEMSETVDAFCTGTWVRDGVIATAKHCVGDAGDVIRYVVKSDVFNPGDLSEKKTRGHLAFVLAVDSAHDLALLGTVGAIPVHATASVTSEQLYQGEMVQTLGNPLGLMFSYSHGDIASVRYANAVGHRGDDKMLFIQTTAPISPGSSGGALFNARGELVGVAHAAYGGRSQNVSLFIHYQYVDALIRKAL